MQKSGFFAGASFAFFLPYALLVLAASVALWILVKLFLRQRTASLHHKRSIVICGPPHSGKTALFTKLAFEKDSLTSTHTVSSLEINQCDLEELQYAEKKIAPPLKLIDVAGNQKVSRLIGPLLKFTKILVFVVDGDAFNVNEAASLLFENVLLKEDFVKYRPNIMLVCNRRGSNDGSPSVTDIKKALERQITQLSRQQETHVAEDEAADQQKYVAIERLMDGMVDFTFDEVCYFTMHEGDIMKDAAFVKQIKQAFEA